MELILWSCSNQCERSLTKVTTHDEIFREPNQEDSTDSGLKCEPSSERASKLGRPW